MADGQSIGAQKGVLGRKIALARARALGQEGGHSLSEELADMGGADMGAAPFEMAAAPAPAQAPHLRAWRLALARAARDQLKMTLGFAELTQTQVSLNEVLETPMQRALILMLQGAGDGMGLMIVSGQMLAAMVEMLTLTHLTPDTPDAADLRKPTRTDAAMAVEFVDAALAGLEGIVAEGGLGPSNHWAVGYRYAAFIEDPRPLHLMLEEGEYHFFAAELALEDGARKGNIWLALPALSAPLAALEPVPDLPAFDPPAALADDPFTEDLAAQVQELPVQLDASLAQISLPLDRLMSLQAGEVLPLPLANLDQITLHGLDGRAMGRARLGQNRGMRALRITDLAFAASRSQGAGPSLAAKQMASSAEIAAHMPQDPPAPPDAPLTPEDGAPPLPEAVGV